MSQELRVCIIKVNEFLSIVDGLFVICAGHFESAVSASTSTTVGKIVR